MVFQKHNNPLTSSAVFDKDDYQQNSVQAMLGIQASKKIRIQPYLRYTKNKGSLGSGCFCR